MSFLYNCIKWSELQYQLHLLYLNLKLCSYQFYIQPLNYSFCWYIYACVCICVSGGGVCVDKYLSKSNVNVNNVVLNSSHFLWSPFPRVYHYIITSLGLLLFMWLFQLIKAVNFCSPSCNWIKHFIKTQTLSNPIGLYLCDFICDPSNPLQESSAMLVGNLYHWCRG